MIFKPKELKFKKLKWFLGLDAVAWYPTAWVKDLSWEILKAHETVHLEKHQYKFYKWGWHFGLILYRILYHLVLPIGWNPIRWWAETQAFIEGNKYNEMQAKSIVRKRYWLWWH